MDRKSNNLLTDTIFSDDAWDEYLYWKSTDEKIFERINRLIKEIKINPYKGIGKPEPLKHNLSGYWSRRINDEHRIVYKVKETCLWISQCRYHYSE